MTGWGRVPGRSLGPQLAAGLGVYFWRNPAPVLLLTASTAGGWQMWGEPSKRLKLSTLKWLYWAARGSYQAAELKMLVFVSEDFWARSLIPSRRSSKAEDEPTILFLSRAKFLMRSKQKARAGLLQLLLK